MAKKMTLNLGSLMLVLAAFTAFAVYPAACAQHGGTVSLPVFKLTCICSFDLMLSFADINSPCWLAGQFEMHRLITIGPMAKTRTITLLMKTYLWQPKV